MIQTTDITHIKRRTWAEIDLDNAAHNFGAVKDCLRRTSPGTKLCCVVKANAYGHSAPDLGRLYQELGADYLAVSNIEEALQLRLHQITLPILILGYTACECAGLLAKYNITQCVFSAEYGKALSRQAVLQDVTLRIHLKMDTGMGRIGFLCRSTEGIREAIEVCRLPGLQAEGIFTHFAVADEGEIGEAYTREQFDAFVHAITAIEAAGIRFALKHCANSAAIFDYPEYHLDMVRPGVILYGLQPSGKLRTKPRLLPVMQLCTVISHIKKLSPGESVSYGRRYIAKKHMTVATLPIGYADGLQRTNGEQNGSVLLGGRSAPIIGRICMDQTMLDVSEIPCSVGDVVTVMGTPPAPTADEIAQLNQTINYEIVCDIGKRVPRAIVKNKRIIAWRDDLLGDHTL